MEEGEIIRLEKSQLLKQVQEKIESLEKEIKTAKEQKKPKKVEKLSVQKEKACVREKMLEDITPQPPHTLRRVGELDGSDTMTSSPRERSLMVLLSLDCCCLHSCID